MAGEKLHNGLVLPDVWPPQDMAGEGTDPLQVPYLNNPPEVICIDIGRQLFVDDFLIESATLKQSFGKPRIHEASPVLSPETDEEMDNGNCPMAAPFNDGAWYDPEDGLFKLWYMPGWFNSTAMATSKDGIHWERPEFDVVPRTNFVWPNLDGYRRDGCLVWLDHDAEKADERYKMFQYYRFGEEGDMKKEGWLHTSPDGIHWSDPIVTTPVGDNTSFFYNPFRKKWCMSVRRWYAGLRTRFYTERDDFLNGVPWNQEQEEVLWQRIDNLALPDPARPNHRVALYDVNVTPYESLMLGLFAIFRGPENHICEAEGVPKTIDLEIGYSRDGFHFSRPDRTPFLEASRQLGDWNRAYLHAVGGVCMVVGDEVWIYFTGFSGESPKLGKTDTGSPRRDWRGMYAGASTGLATIRRDGFVSMDAGAEGGVLTTNSVIFKASRLFVNVDNPHGELKVELLVDGQPVAGLDAESCVPVSKDSTCCEVTWRSGIDLSRVANRSVQFRFHLKSGRLFSFWVTDKPNGASAGYLGAGGPGYANGRDL
jgi:hypothetical protein